MSTWDIPRPANPHVRHMAQNVLEIHVSDDGVGLPEGFDVRNTSTVGIPLVSQIVRRQLQGSVHYESRDGLHWRITLREDVYTERV